MRRGLAGLRSLLWQRDGETLAQPCNSAVWSTALVSYCLRETGLEAEKWLKDGRTVGPWRAAEMSVPSIQRIEREGGKAEIVKQEVQSAAG